jgi:hypothetical protein
MKRISLRGRKTYQEGQEISHLRRKISLTRQEAFHGVRRTSQ